MNLKVHPNFRELQRCSTKNMTLWKDKKSKKELKK